MKPCVGQGQVFHFMSFLLWSVRPLVSGTDAAEWFDRQEASERQQREASRGVEGGGNERPLVAGTEAQRNLARMPGLSRRSLHSRYLAYVFWAALPPQSSHASVGFPSTIRVSGSLFPLIPSRSTNGERTVARPRLIYLFTPRRSFVRTLFTSRPSFELARLIESHQKIRAGATHGSRSRFELTRSFSFIWRIPAGRKSVVSNDAIGCPTMRIHVFITAGA